MKSISTRVNQTRLKCHLALVIGIAQCTNAVVAAEMSVKISATSDGTAALTNTPQTQVILSYSLVYAGVRTW